VFENIIFRKLVLFSSLGEGRETSTLLNPLEKANLNHWPGFLDFVHRPKF
jgi:hypothetical protein